MTGKILSLLATVACLVILAVLLADAWVSVSAPWSHRAGEGMMIWMSRELAAGRSPYGDILEVPSVYSCYGPFPSALAALIKMLFFGKVGGIGYAYAGRVLTFLAWCAASFSIPAILRLKGPQVPVAACVFLCVLSPFWLFFTFRVDPVQISIEAFLLLSLVRLEGRRLMASVSVLSTLLALTKIPAALDIVPICLMSAFLRGESLGEAFARLWRPLLVGAVVSSATLFLANLASGGWMLKDILATQMESLHATEGTFAGIHTYALLSIHMLPLWMGVFYLVLSGRSPLAMLSLALSLLVCGTLATKDGADVNYYIPFLFLATVASVFALAKTGKLWLAGLLLPMATLPLDRALHREPPSVVETRTNNNAKLLRLHDQKDFLTDDPFYSVLTGRSPLATDLFQLGRVLSSRQKSPSALLERANQAWGGEFLGTLLNRDPSSLPAPSHPLPYGYATDAAVVWNPSSVQSGRPPFIDRGGPPVREWAKRVALPSLLLALSAFPFAGVSARRARRSCQGIPGQSPPPSGAS